MKRWVVGVALCCATGCDVSGPAGRQVEFSDDSVSLWPGEVRLLVSSRVEPSRVIDFWSSAPLVAEALAGGRALAGRPGEAWIYVGRQSTQSVQDSIHIVVQSAADAAAKLEFMGSVLDEGGTLTGIVRVVNPGTEVVPLYYGGGCAPFIVLWTGADTVWNQKDWWSARPGGCKWSPIERAIEPGAQISISTASIAFTEITGDGVLAREYNMGIELMAARWEKTESGMRSVVDSTFFVPAGVIIVR